jgi:hypothetical protein
MDATSHPSVPELSEGGAAGHKQCIMTLILPFQGVTDGSRSPRLNEDVLRAIDEGCQDP